MQVRLDLGANLVAAADEQPLEALTVGVAAQQPLGQVLVVAHREVFHVALHLAGVGAGEALAAHANTALAREWLPFKFSASASRRFRSSAAAALPLRSVSRSAWRTLSLMRITSSRCDWSRGVEG